MLTDEALRLAKIPDLDGLEQLARQAASEEDAYLIYAGVFDSLEGRTRLSPKMVLAWGERFIAWAWSFPERGGLPFFGKASWAPRLLRRAQVAGRRDLALAVTEALLASDVLSERERAWWQNQRRRLAASPKVRRKPR